jgi:hypothetical protein
MDIFDEIYWESLPKNQPLVAECSSCCPARPETFVTVVTVSSDSEEDGYSLSKIRELAGVYGKCVDIVTIESDSSSASPSPKCYSSSFSSSSQHQMLPNPPAPETLEVDHSALSLLLELKMPSASHGRSDAPSSTLQLLLADTHRAHATAACHISGFSQPTLLSHCVTRFLIHPITLKQGMWRVGNVRGMIFTTILAFQMNRKSHA